MINIVYMITLCVVSVVHFGRVLTKLKLLCLIHDVKHDGHEHLCNVLCLLMFNRTE